MQIAQELGKIIHPRLITDSLIDRHAHAADAGFYFLLPKAIVFPETTDDIIALFRFCTEHTIPLTFRAAGTSLSGQSITDGILVDISRSFKKIQPQKNYRFKTNTLFFCVETITFLWLNIVTEEIKS